MDNRRQPDQNLLEYQLNEEKRLLEIEHTIKALELKIDTLSGSVSDLVSAWKAANIVVSFIKWVGGAATAVTALYTLLKLKG